MGGVTSHLLDTHAVLWALTRPERLGNEARRVISDRSSTLIVSAASAWEIALKHRLGKLPQADVLLRSYDRHLERLGAQALPITDRHALLAGGLDWTHRDPFDRMLAAQAMTEGMVLITRDEVFTTIQGVSTLW